MVFPGFVECYAADLLKDIDSIRGRADLKLGFCISKVLGGTEAKRGFVLLPRRWVVERSFAWAARFRRLARD